MDNEYNIIEAAMEWVIDISTRGSRSFQTRRNYAYALFHFFAWLNERSYCWNLITKNELRQYQTDMLRMMKEDGTPLDNSTINYRIDRLCEFYQFASKAGYKHFVDLELEIKKINLPKDQILLAHTCGSQKEIKTHDLKLLKTTKRFRIIPRAKFIQACQAFNDLVYVVIAIIMYATGLRRSEVIQMEYRSQANPDFISIAELREKKKGKIEDLGFRFIGKGGKKRTIPFPVEIWEMVDKYYLPIRKTRAEQYRKKYGRYPKELFLSKSGKPITASGLDERFRSVAKKIGFPFRCHLLRHSFATFFVENYLKVHNIGADIEYDFALDEALRIYMGHASMSTTKTYIHLCHVLKGGDLIRDYRPCIGEDIVSIMKNVNSIK